MNESFSDSHQSVRNWLLLPLPGAGASQRTPEPPQNTPALLHPETPSVLPQGQTLHTEQRVSSSRPRDGPGLEHAGSGLPLAQRLVTCRAGCKLCRCEGARRNSSCPQARTARGLDWDLAASHPSLPPPTGCGQALLASASAASKRSVLARGACKGSWGGESRPSTLAKGQRGSRIPCLCRTLPLAHPCLAPRSSALFPPPSPGLPLGAQNWGDFLYAGGKLYRREVRLLLCFPIPHPAPSSSSSSSRSCRTLSLPPLPPQPSQHTRAGKGSRHMC